MYYLNVIYILFFFFFFFFLYHVVKISLICLVRLPESPFFLFERIGKEEIGEGGAVTCRHLRYPDTLKCTAMHLFVLNRESMI